MTTLRKIGIALAGASILAAVVIQLLTGQVLTTQVESDAARGAPSGMTDNFVFVKLHPGYGIPLGLCLATGVLFIVWPSRKPPRIT